jgi:uncharacterized LabA/DUF88 family protein
MKSNTLTYAFIDSQNVNLGTQINGWKLDFGKFRTYLLTKFKVKKTYLFIGYIEGNSSLYHYLQEVGYILIFKHVLEIKKDNKTTVKGNVDAELVLHAMIEYPHYNHAIIVSGDGDFFCLVEYLEKNHKLAKVIVPNHQYSSLLRKYASHIFPLSIAKEKLQIKKEKERHSRGK